MRRVSFSFVVMVACSPQVGGADGTADSSTSAGQCVVGQVACDCTPGGGCDPGLRCIVGVCIPDELDTGSSATSPADSGEVASSMPESSADSQDTAMDTGPLDSSSEGGSSTTGIPTDCGNGRIDGDEVCDDGNTVTGDGCNADCQPGGQEIWTVILDGGAQDRDEAHRVAVDADDDIYVTGFFGTGVQNELDAVLIKLDDDGQQQWIETFASDVPFPSTDSFWGVAVLPDQSVVVAGSRVLDTNQREAMVRAYDPDGAVLWDYFEPDVGDSYAFDVAVDSAGDIVVTGGAHDPMIFTQQTWLAKLTADGDIVWNYRLDVPSVSVTTALAVDSSDAIAIGACNGYCYVRRLDADGQELWTWSDIPGGNAAFIGIDTDAADGIFVAGAQQGGTWFAHHPADGIDPDWMDSWNGGMGGGAESWQVVVDSSGRTIWVGGLTSAMSNFYIAAHKLDTDASVAWSDEVMSPNFGYDVASGVAVDSLDQPIYVGRQRQLSGNDDIIIRKLTP